MEDRKLTSMQSKFCDYYIASGNATESARRAGYSNRTARAIGHENLTKPNIIKKIEEVSEKLASERIADMTEVQEFWTSLMRDNGVEVKDQLKASEYISKTNGAFLDKVEHSGEVNLIDKAKVIDKYLRGGKDE